MADVVVVGGGLGGLVTATLLARSGRSVVVLERGAGVGGRARSQVKEGLTLNLGPHALYLRGAAAAVLAELGVTWQGTRVPTEAYGARGGEVVPLPSGLWSLATLPWLPVAQRLELARVQMQLPFLARRGGERSVADWLAAVTPAVADVVRAIIRVSTYSNAPERLDAAVAARQVMHALRGVAYIDGGWQSLVDAVHARAVAAGVDVRCSADVVEVHADGVRTTEAAWTAPHVVLAVPPAAARALGVELSELVPARAACLDLLLEGRPPTCPRAVFGLDEPVYLSDHSRTARLGDGVVVTLARYLAPGEPSTGAIAGLERFADAVWPGWRGFVRGTRAIPDLLAAGAIDALDAPRAPLRADGIWLVGDHVASGALLLDGVVASARQAVAGVLASGVRKAA